ncbi:hypothetical protein ACOI1H_19190 [Loktanella sp. DJP18]|uniref:hypothetical protein n=1 Tax=Loktanella sp. DJP18 TaxID=3409788 RepID=UPI003BB48F37
MATVFSFIWNAFLLIRNIASAILVALIFVISAYAVFLAADMTPADLELKSTAAGATDFVQWLFQVLLVLNPDRVMRLFAKLMDSNPTQKA